MEFLLATSWGPAVLLGSVLLLAALLLLRPLVLRRNRQVQRILECGHLAPPPSDRDLASMLSFCRGFVKLFVGKLEVQGQEKLAAMDGPFLLAFNHGSMLDVVIAPLVLGRKARYPAAQGAMQAFGGRAGLLMSRWGAFAVDLQNGHKALEASVDVLCSGDDANIEVIFPEAWTNMDGVVGKFKTGTVRIAAAASARLGRPVPIVPGHMSYGRYPGSWITKLPIPVQWLIPLLFAFYYRRGCKVVIGDPVDLSSLPVDPKEATEHLRELIISLNPRAAAN